MKIDFDKFENGLAPAVIQDSKTGKVLMLGYMNKESLAKTQEEKRVVFYSRSKKRLWMKGEESGNFLHMQDILADCDNDAILIKAIPAGPVCHTGADTCWNEKNEGDFLTHLESVIRQRKKDVDGKSYTSSLFKSGINKIAQKVGEEATEVIIEAKDNNRDLFLNESADLLFHYLVLLAAKDVTLNDVITVLKSRHK
jgi:phosphoribosyl-ATP pyrophosphohydrolase/phosphoribosyl-AMP cyclohydrolase